MITGERCGAYLILERIAVGGMSELFLAVRQGPAGFERGVIIKRLLRRLADDRRFVAMLQDEARLIARLNHPNIVQTYDFGLDNDGCFFLALEYLNGEDLHSICSRFPEQYFPPHLAAYIAARAADGLHHAHTATDIDGKDLLIVHRDVTPSNLVVTIQGEVKLIDFGIAKASRRLAHTEPGMLKGKLHYLAPERLREQPADHRVDIYSLGMTLFRCLAGTLPLSTTDLARVTRGEHVRPLRLREVMPSADPVLEAIIERALAPDPEDRFATAKEMANALDGYINEIGDVPLRQELVVTLNALYGEQHFIQKAQRPYVTVAMDRATMLSVAIGGMPRRRNSELTRRHGVQ